MCNYESPFEPNEHVKIWLYGDRYSCETENSCEFYIRVGKTYLFHAEGAPAKRLEDADGVHEEYWTHGKLHRGDGPAIVCYKGAPFIFPKDISVAERISEYMRHAHQCHYEWYWQDQKCSFREWLDLAGLPEKERALLLLKHR